MSRRKYLLDLLVTIVATLQEVRIIIVRINSLSHSLMHFINRCTWKSSQYYIIISMMTSFMRVSQKLVFHQRKCISAIKRILSTTAMYVSSSSFMYLRIPC